MNIPFASLNVCSAVFLASALKLSSCKTLQYVTEPNHIKATAKRLRTPLDYSARTTLIAHKGYSPNEV